MRKTGPSHESHGPSSRRLVRSPFGINSLETKHRPKCIYAYA